MVSQLKMILSVEFLLAFLAKALINLHDLAFGFYLLDFAPHTIDNSQPLDGKYEQAGASEVAISIDTTRKKLYR